MKYCADRNLMHLLGRQKRLKYIHKVLHVHWDPQQAEGPARIQKEESPTAAAGAQGSLPANAPDCC